MSTVSPTKSLLVVSSVALLIILGTILTILFARGYRLSLQRGVKVQITGILSATSRPRSASVYIDNHLITATDDTLNLSPGNYTIKIIKDGYLPWQKKLEVKPEIVSQTDTDLFRSVPDLKPVTLTGALNPTANLDQTRIVYAVASASASRDNGLFLLELNSLFSLTRNPPRRLAANTNTIDWSKFTFSFSPNSRQILANSPTAAYLLEIDNPLVTPKITDVTYELPLIEHDWKNQTAQIIDNRLSHLPPDLISLIATDSPHYLNFSSTDDRVLYLCQTKGTLPQILSSPPPVQNLQPQTRDLQPGNFYVYDLKEDTNYLLGNKSNFDQLSWIPNSNNLLFVRDQKIREIEYDGSNEQTLYAGLFNPEKVYLWPDGNRIILLTAPYTGTSENLYTLTIR